MEGIQHRWDCPNPDAEPDEHAFELADGTTRGYAKCPNCGRAAIIHRPKETTDEHSDIRPGHHHRPEVLD